MRKFLVLLRKEVKELITPQLIIPMIAIVLIFNLIGGMLKKQSREDAGTTKLAVLDRDGTALSKKRIQELQSSFEVTVVADAKITEIFSSLEDEKINSLLVIPDGFEKASEKFRPFNLEVYTKIRSLSMKGATKSSSAKRAFNRIIISTSREMLRRKVPDVSPVVLRAPVHMNEFVIVGEKTARISLMSVYDFFFQQASFIPMILFMIIFIAAQMLATAIATEKEDKTLETLLSTPVSRGNIVSAKMTAAALVSLMLIVFYMIGFRNYMGGIHEEIGLELGKRVHSMAALAELGMVMSPADYLLLGLTVFFGILCALALAVILSSFAENAKSVHGLITPLMILIIFPYMLIQLLDLSRISGAMKVLIYANPFSYPFLATPCLLLDDQGMIYRGLILMAVFFILLMVAAARIFSSDLIITMKLNFRKKKERKPE